MSFKNKIKESTGSWVEKGIISKEQRILIIENVGSGSGTSNFFKIIATIGALFIGLGIILLISSNWEYLPKGLKLILILFMPIVSIGAGYYLSYIKEEYNKIGDSLIFLGSLLVGASLALLSQLYNMDGSVLGLLIWWIILTLPLTLFFRFRTLAFVTISLFYLALFYFVEDFLSKETREQELIWVFTIVSALVFLGSLISRKKIINFSKIFKVFEVVSLKVFLAFLFIGTLHEKLALFGRSEISLFIQNIIFLVVVFFVLWFSNKNYNSRLRNLTFFWLALFMITKYFSWFWGYMETGLFSVLFGLLLMFLVWGYIRGVKFLKNMKKGYVEKINSKKLYVILTMIVLFFIGFIAVNEYTLKTGEEVFLETVPVDPRGLLGGDFVILTYKIEENIIANQVIEKNNLKKGDYIYILLNKDSEKLGTLKNISMERPEKGLYIKGRIGNRHDVELGIEKYFVPENRGHEIERSLDELKVLVAIDKNGTAKIKALYYKGEEIDFKKEKIDR